MRLCVSFAAAILFAAALLAPAQETSVPGFDPSAAAIQQAQEALDRALTEFAGTQQSRSIVLFEQAIERLQSLRLQGLTSPRIKEMLVQAYEHRGRAYYAIGLQDKAVEDFRTLVQLQPQHNVSKERVSPKVVEFFANVKKGMVGQIAVESVPPGARVTLNGEFLALTDFFPIDVLAGEYTVEVARDGYMTETRPVVITPKSVVPLQVNLTRTAASLFIITEPSGVEVWIDGQQRAVTSGTLDPQFHDSVREKGLDPNRAGARLEITNLPLGSRAIELRRKCYEPVRFNMELPEAKDYFAEPLKLQESLASVRLTSEPPGALIFLDGEPMGRTPREIEGVCAGRHRLEVKHQAGKFLQDLVLGRNESVTIDCPIRPTLAFLGVVAEGPNGERALPEASELLASHLAKIRSLNFISAPRETVNRLLQAESLSLKSLVVGATRDTDDADSGRKGSVRKVTEKLAAQLEVQGFLVAVLPEQRVTQTAVLHLLAAANAEPDSWDVAFAESLSYTRFLSAVDQRAVQYKPWTGLITVDTRQHEGVPVLRVVPGSPAALAGVEPGVVLFAVDGQPVKRTSDLIAAVELKKAHDVLGLHLRGPSGDRVVEVRLALTPQEIPLNDSTLLYNKVMMDLRQQVDGYPGTERAALARLNLGLCAMHFDDFASAREHLQRAAEPPEQGGLPVRPGISQGTAFYYLGLAWERLGREYKVQAQNAYKEAARFKDATLFNNDGPTAAPIAERRAGSLVRP
jgi:tetratricopeptide (TPR) repeat protein